MSYKSILSVAAITMALSIPAMAQEKAKPATPTTPATPAAATTEAAASRTPIEIMNDVTAQVKAFNEVLQSVKTAETADIAAGRIDTIVKDLETLKKETEDENAPELTEADAPKIMAIIGEIGKLQQAIQSELERIDKAEIDSEKLDASVEKFMKIMDFPGNDDEVIIEEEEVEED